MKVLISVVVLVYSIICTSLLADDMMTVSIDINPESRENKIDRANTPILKVAIHSTSDFDASRVVDDAVLVLAGASGSIQLFTFI